MVVKKMQRTGSLGWTKFDGETYTPMFKVWKTRKQAQSAGRKLRDKGIIENYRTIKYSNPFKEVRLRGYLLFIKGKLGNTGHLSKYLK